MEISEKEIEEYLMGCPLKDVFSSNEVLSPEFNQVATPAGYIIDIIYMSGSRMVIGEIKKDKIGDRALAQLLKYMGDVNESLGLNFEEGVYGVLIAPEIDIDTQSSIKAVQHKVRYVQLYIEIEPSGCFYSTREDIVESESYIKNTKTFEDLFAKINKD